MTGDEALRNLQSTNNFPEFTGRVCPAPCEASCTLNLEDARSPSRRSNARSATAVWQEGWILPEPAEKTTGKRVAVVGSGPAGLAAAQQLARVGHEVHVFEKHARAGGLLRYGIPDFKMEKHHVDRRVRQMEAEGVTFHYGVHVGAAKPGSELLDEFDAVLLAGGAEKPRDLRSRAASCPASISPWISCRSRTGASRREHATLPIRSSRPRSTSWSSAAATPAPTASAPRPGRARSRSPSSRSCRSRRCARTSSRPGPTGR